MRKSRHLAGTASIATAAAMPSPAAEPVVVPPAADPLSAIVPAIDAAAARAATERVADPAAGEALPPIAPAADSVPLAIAGNAGLPTTVLPEPSLVPPEGVVPPVVTAAPPLAAEPSAVDVMQAATAAVDRTPNFAGHATGAGSAPAGPHFAEAGQPTLAIQSATPTAGAVAAEAAATPLPADPDVAGIEVLEVTGPERGRWRAGLAFGRESRRFVRSQITDEQLEAIQSDPQLSWRFRTLTAVDAII